MYGCASACVCACVREREHACVCVIFAVCGGGVFWNWWGVRVLVKKNNLFLGNTTLCTTWMGKQIVAQKFALAQAPANGTSLQLQ